MNYYRELQRDLEAEEGRGPQFSRHNKVADEEKHDEEEEEG